MPELNQYQEDFENLVLTDPPIYNGQYSVKTNFVTIFNYLKNVKKILGIFKNYMIYLKSEINAVDIVNNVTQNIMVNKVNFNININQVLNTSELITIQDVLYKVTKLRDNEYEISKDSEAWNVDNIIVDVKNLNGEKIYPIIKTIGGKINIIFTEQPTINFKVIIL